MDVVLSAENHDFSPLLKERFVVHNLTYVT